MRDAQSSDVRNLSHNLFETQPAPAHLVRDESQLGAQLSALLTPDVRLGSNAPDVGFIHRHTDSAEIYFIANTGNRPISTGATFRVAGMKPELWNPMTGEVSEVMVQGTDFHRAVIAQGKATRTHPSGVSVKLELAPYESRVLVFTKGVPREALADLASPPISGVDLGGPWSVRFRGVGERQMEQLHSW